MMLICLTFDICFFNETNVSQTPPEVKGHGFPLPSCTSCIASSSSSSSPPSCSSSPPPSPPPPRSEARTGLAARRSKPPWSFSAASSQPEEPRPAPAPALPSRRPLRLVRLLLSRLAFRQRDLWSRGGVRLFIISRQKPLTQEMLLSFDMKLTKRRD